MIKLIVNVVNTASSVPEGMSDAVFKVSGRNGKSEKPGSNMLRFFPVSKMAGKRQRF